MAAGSDAAGGASNRAIASNRAVAVRVRHEGEHEKVVVRFADEERTLLSRFVKRMT